MEKKILIIEDNLEVRESLEEVLELSGYQVNTAENGIAGVECALKDPPDLVLCDVMMPKLDGFGVLNILNKKPATASIPFIFLTAKAEKEDFRRGMNLGADDYITKPFYKDDLLNVIETRLQKHKQLQQKFDKTSGGLSAFIQEAKGYEELKRLSEDRRRKKLKAKEILVLEGDFPRYLYFVNSGQLKIYRTNEYNKDYIIKICGAGTFVGYTPLITGENYKYSVAALQDSEVDLVPKEDFAKLLFANRDVSYQLIKMLAENVDEKEEQLLNLAYSSVRKRVANALLKVHSQYESKPNQEIEILRDDLAKIVGTAKESVIRTLSEFRNDGYIDIVDGKITILDKKVLEALPF